MHALRSAIDKKKKQLDALKSREQTWIRKADEIEAERRKARDDIEQQAQRKKQCVEKQLERVGNFFAEEGTKQTHDATSSDATTGTDGETGALNPQQRTDISDEVLTRELRKHRQPALIFAETKQQRFKRLYEHVVKSKLTKDSQNVFVDTIMGRAQNPLSQRKITDEHAIYDELKDVPKDTKHGRIGAWLNDMLRAWQKEVEAQRDELVEKESAAEAKRRDAMLAQTKQDLLPLVRLLKAQTLEQETLDKIHNVVECCQKGDYKAAHDAYMLLAIGNAAWPMGVTMVGIHERAGRSKIFASEVAHILNDETTRKYIQMIKRLLSFAQKLAPADPSKQVQISTMHI